MANKNYNSTLQSNNTDLQAILDAINELPEAGGGSENLTDVLNTQEAKLNELLTILDGKAAGGGGTLRTFTLILQVDEPRGYSIDECVLAVGYFSQSQWTMVEIGEIAQGLPIYEVTIPNVDTDSIVCIFLNDNNLTDITDISSAFEHQYTSSSNDVLIYTLTNPNTAEYITFWGGNL